MKLLVAFVLLCALVPGFTSAPGEPIVATHYITNVLITMHLYDTKAELQSDLEVDGVKGYSECEINEEENIAYCDIYSVRPTHIDDDATTTVGHEVLHGVFGLYHGL